MGSIKDLLVSKKVVEISLAIFHLTKGFSNDVKCGVTKQMNKYENIKWFLSTDDLLISSKN
jgi:hypothetical protein